MTWTEYYISLSASGGDGSEGSPWTLAEWWTNVEDSTVGNGSRGNVKDDGTYTQADLVTTRDALDHAPIVTQGYLATPGDGGRPTIQRTAGEVGGWINTNGSNFLMLADLKLDALGIGDGNGEILRTSTSSNSQRCELTGGSFGSMAYNCGKMTDCYIHNSTATTGVYNTWLHNCFVDGALVTGQVVHTCWLTSTIVRNKGAGNVHAAIGAQMMINSILDGSRGTRQLINGDQAQGYTAVNCIFANAAPGQVAISGGVTLINPVFFNNLGGNYDNTKAVVVNEREADPKFVNPAGLDYRIRNKSLYGSGLSQTGLQRANYQISPGVDQVAVIIPASGDVIETDNNYGYSGDPVRGTYVRASGDQTIEGTSWGEDGTEFTGLWETVIASEVQLAVTFGPSGSLTGTLDAITYSMPITLTVTAESLNISLEVS